MQNGRGSRTPPTSNSPGGAAAAAPADASSKLIGILLVYTLLMIIAQRFMLRGWAGGGRAGVSRSMLRAGEPGRACRRGRALQGLAPRPERGQLLIIAQRFMLRGWAGGGGLPPSGTFTTTLPQAPAVGSRPAAVDGRLTSALPDIPINRGTPVGRASGAPHEAQHGPHPHHPRRRPAA